MIKKLPARMVTCWGVVFLLSSALPAQVVQLPSFGQTSYSGTVSVPDGGTAALGGVGYSAYGVNQRGWGPFAGRAAGGRAGGSSLSVSAQIIDLQAMDEAILGRNTNRVSGSMGPQGSTVNQSDRSYLSGFNYGPSRGQEVQAQNPNEWRLALAGGGTTRIEENESQVEADIRYYLQQGKEAEQNNRVLSARVFYRMAVERMTPEMVERYKKILADREAEEKKRLENNRPDRIKF